MLPVSEPNLHGREREYVYHAVQSGWVSGGGAYVDKFENMVAKACGVQWAVAVLTGSAALHLALEVQHTRDQIGVHRMPSLMFCAAANAIIQSGGKPYFHEVEERWTPDFNRIGKKVIDAAPSIGMPIVADPGVLICLSFNGNKNITTGQGGAVLGNDLGLETEVRHLAGVAKKSNYEVDAVGFNYRMPNPNAAIGCAQMERLDEFLVKKQEIFERYKEAGFELVYSSWMALWKCPEGRTSEFLNQLWNKDIGARPFWKPLHLQFPYRNFLRDADLRHTEELAERLICLPCSTTLDERNQDRVIECVHSIW